MNQLGRVTHLVPEVSERVPGAGPTVTTKSKKRKTVWGSMVSCGRQAGQQGQVVDRRRGVSPQLAATYRRTLGLVGNLLCAAVRRYPTTGGRLVSLRAPGTHTLGVGPRTERRGNGCVRMCQPQCTSCTGPGSVTIAGGTGCRLTRPDVLPRTSA